LSARKSNCCIAGKPKARSACGVDHTVRLTPSASGLAQADFAGTGAGAGAGGVAAFEDSDAVTSTSSFALAAAGAGKGSALRAAIV